jgi:cytochrome c-type biogenesis protein CcmH
VKFVPYIGFALVALAAIAFAAVPLWRSAESWKAKALLGGAVALFVLGIGIGVYWAVGEPKLALRDAMGTESGELGALTPLLIERVRANPNDQQAWMYLARIYITAGDARQAAGALGRAIIAGRKSGAEESADLNTAHGELLIQASGGQVSPPAMEAFNTAIKIDPQNAPARYYLGMAAAQKGDNATAAKYWQSLLADVPTTSPLRSELIDRLASIGSAPARVTGKDGAPDPMAMVAGLAERLKKQPNDAAGWLRLIRAYNVLGEFGKAKEALATARKTVGADATVKAALDEQAKELKLE